MRRYKQILVEVGAFQRGWVTLRANFRWKVMSPQPLLVSEYYNVFLLPKLRWYQKTRVFLLPHSEDTVILFSFVCIGYQRVTDGRTDKRTDRRMYRRNCCRYYRALHCKECGRAVKMTARAEARSAARAEVFQPGHLTWRALASRRHWLLCV